MSIAIFSDILYKFLFEKDYSKFYLLKYIQNLFDKTLCKEKFHFRLPC